MTRTIIAALALAVLATEASAQESTSTLRDGRGNVLSRSTTTGNTTTVYDPSGRSIGRYTTTPSTLH